LIALAYGTIFHKPVWVWWGGTTHTEHKIGLLKKSLRKLVSRWATRWISYGHSSTEYLRTLGIPRERVLQIQNAVDEHRFTQAAEPAPQRQPRPVLLYVGQLIARKGVELLLNAAATVQAQGHEFSLLLVGSGPDKPILEQRIKDLKLGNVSFQPSLPPDRMPSIYRSADVLIFPTLEDPWGLVVNEAMLSGLPVLCSRCAGCAEELLTADSIFDPKNSDEFATKLRQAVSGQLPKPDLSRLKTMSQVLDQLVRDLHTRMSDPFKSLPATSTELPIQR
jgi:glycosyltransferase involved in cell wall biosynthesis